MAERNAIDRELTKLRKRQADKVMAKIGGLLDAWEGVPNDFRGEIEEHATVLAEYLDEIMAIVEDE